MGQFDHGGTICAALLELFSVSSHWNGTVHNLSFHFFLQIYSKICWNFSLEHALLFLRYQVEKKKRKEKKEVK